MKAYGMGRLLRDSMGTRSDVHTDEDDRNYLRITSELTPTQLNQLQMLADVNGWEIAYKGRPDVWASPSLALVPKVKVEVGK